MAHNYNATSCDSQLLNKTGNNISATELSVKSDKIADEDGCLMRDYNVQNESHSNDNVNLSESELREKCEEKSSNNEFLGKRLSSETVVDNSIKTCTILSEDKSDDTDIKSDCFINLSQEQRNDNISSSLKMIAVEYSCLDSDVVDSDTDFSSQATKENEIVKRKDTMEEQNKMVYRIPQKKTLPSDKSDSEDDISSSSSDMDSSSNSSSTSSLMNHTDESDNDSNTLCSSRNQKSTRSSVKEMKSELDDLPPIEDLTISVPEVLCDPVGEVSWTVEQLVVVRPKPGKPTLNLDTVLFVDKGQRALGKIFDVFGQVTEPHYCVRFNSSEHIQQKDIRIGMTVYYCPNTPYTSLVFLHELTKMKGTDDVDGENEAPDFSDDEEEQKYYAALKGKDRKAKNNANTIVPNKRRRGSSPTGWKSNHPWNRNANFQKHKEGYSRGSDGAWLRNAPQNSYHPHNPRPPMSPGFPYQHNPWYPPMHAENLNDSYKNPYFNPVHTAQGVAYDMNMRYPYNNPYSHPQGYSEGPYGKMPIFAEQQASFPTGSPWIRIPLETPISSLPPLPPPPPPPPPQHAASSSTHNSPST